MKVLRSIPEQVAKNATDIAELKKTYEPIKSLAVFPEDSEIVIEMAINKGIMPQMFILDVKLNGDLYTVYFKTEYDLDNLSWNFQTALEGGDGSVGIRYLDFTDEQSLGYMNLYIQGLDIEDYDSVVIEVTRRTLIYNFVTGEVDY